jgi:hypothetical protein
MESVLCFLIFNFEADGAYILVCPLVNRFVKKKRENRMNHKNLFRRVERKYGESLKTFFMWVSVLIFVGSLMAIAFGLVFYLHKLVNT